jgi:hypothetical protein
MMLGSFMWGKRSNTRCISWEPRGGEGGLVTGEHDGYARLPDPVTHRRTVELDGKSRVVTIRDRLLAKDEHEVSVNFQLSENCTLSQGDSNVCKADVGCGTLTLELDQRFSVEILKGSEAPIGGWVSRGYHRKVPILKS